MMEVRINDISHGKAIEYEAKIKRKVHLGQQIDLFTFFKLKYD